MLNTIIANYHKYWFLLSQLVERDFKTKYRRSVLGVLWSVLNPLMTMTVQFIVFSSLFRFNTPNYAVYLLSGIILFNFMSEATAQSMSSIISNASLINKVYVPKYIYPFSRVLSCGVNFIFSMCAMYIVIIISGLRLTVFHFANLYVIGCLFIFICGLSLLLATLMVFFRDTQFLYSVTLTIWTYLTPIFYPESILPPQALMVIKLNPMYHFIRFFRSIILDGALPEPKAWLYCAVFGFTSFVIGTYVFKKNQNNFILNL